MLFPESQRVVYAQNPLQEVISQLKFPTILRISAELPVAFQEKLKGEYPFFQQKPALTPLIQAGYDFISKDGRWTVGLTKDFVALSTTDYRNWPDFKKRLDFIQQAFDELYSPPFFSRIGLRYQDIIRRSQLNLKDVAWPELIKLDLAGELSSPSLGNSIEEIFQQIVFRLDKYDALVRVQHGIVVAQDGTNEQCYLIDNDFFTIQQTELKNAGEILTHFNRENGNFFRSVISGRLTEALGVSTDTN